MKSQLRGNYSNNITCQQNNKYNTHTHRHTNILNNLPLDID